MLNKLKEFELFEGMSIDKIFKEIYDRSTEERQRAIDTFDKIVINFQDKDDMFLIGDKANPYLDIAQKATDNLTKMLSTAQKLVEAASGETQSDPELEREAMIKMLDEANAIPEELKQREKIAQETLEKMSSIVLGTGNSEELDEEDSEKEIVSSKFKLKI